MSLNKCQALTFFISNQGTLFHFEEEAMHGNDLALIELEVYRAEGSLNLGQFHFPICSIGSSASQSLEKHTLDVCDSM